MSLSRVDVVFPFWSLFPIFPRTQTVAGLLYSQSNSIGNYFLYSPGGQIVFDFILYAFLLVVFLGSSFRYSPVFKTFLVNFWFLVILIG